MTNRRAEATLRTRPLDSAHPPITRPPPPSPSRSTRGDYKRRSPRAANKNLHCGRYSPRPLRQIVRACPRIYCEIRNVTFRGSRRSVTIDAPRRRRVGKRGRVD